MEAETRLFEILNNEDIPAFHWSSFLDVDSVPAKFFIFNNLRTRNMRADNKIILESLLYQIYFYSDTPVTRPTVKAKIKELEAEGFQCGPISDIGKIDRKFGLSFTVQKTQKF